MHAGKTRPGSRQEGTLRWPGPWLLLCWTLPPARQPARPTTRQPAAEPLPRTW